MKFHKKHITSYHCELPMDNDMSLTNTAAHIRSFVDSTAIQIEKDGYKCDEYDTIYFSSLEDRLMVWFNVHYDNQGLLIVHLPPALINLYRPITISETIENALKEEE